MTTSDPRGDDSAGGRFELDPPLNQVAWSPEFGSRSLEIFFVGIAEGSVVVLRPIHAPTLMLGWGPSDHPGSVVVEAARRYGLDPVLVHSTSWRSEPGRLVLTYLAVVRDPVDPGPHLRAEPVARNDLARGGALHAPAEIPTEAVLEHALRHLRWLIGDDESVRDAVPDWAPALEAYVPEPFRAFGAGMP